MATLVDGKLTLWIAVLGGAGAGKQTTLKGLRSRLHGASPLREETTRNDQTLVSFDAPLGPLGPLAVWMKLICLSGPVFYDADRERIIRGSTGAILVADRSPSRAEINVESARNLERHAGEADVRAARFPVLVQLNKGDVRKALPADRARASLDLPASATIETVASKGAGLDRLAAAIVKDLAPRVIRRIVALELAAKEHPGAADFAAEAERLITTLPAPIG